MLNEIATDLHNQLTRNKTQEHLIPSDSLCPETFNVTLESDYDEDLPDQVTPGDPNWMVPPPIPSYGKG
jgi:hypothetical protein